MTDVIIHSLESSSIKQYIDSIVYPEDIYKYVAESNIKRVEDKDILYIIDSYLQAIKIPEYEYKNNNKIKYLTQINSLFNNIVIVSFDCNQKYYFFLEHVVTTTNVQTILDPIKLNYYTDDSIHCLLNLAVEKGTFPIVYYLYNFILNKNKTYFTKSDEISLLSTCFRNSDNRIYKYFLQLVTCTTNTFINIDNLLIEDIIINIFSNHIPSKYILRRLKDLSGIICLEKYINELINLSYFKYQLVNKGDYNLVSKIIKYYYTSTELSINSINIIISHIINTFSESEHIVSDKIIYINDLLKTCKEKNILFITVYCYTFNTFGLKLQYNNSKEHIDNVPTNELLLDLLNIYPECIIENPSVLLDIIKLYSNNDLLNNITSYNCHAIIARMPFVTYFTSDLLRPQVITQLNKCLLFLRIYIRKNKKKKQNIQRLTFLPIINEMKSIKPSNLLPIFKHGTNFFRNNLCLFNQIPPYHIMPGQLNQMESNSYYLKEKVDGILVNNLPKHIDPPINIKDVNSIKAEYIEELDLYLIFDINIPATIEDRYHYLRKLHYSTKDIIEPIINTMDELKIAIINENDNLLQFLKKPYTTYRWYPKAAWKINNHFNMIQDYNEILNNNHVKIHSVIPTDGFIITPFNGNREIKLKPKNLLTIDLLFKNNKWLDKEGNKWNHIVKTDPSMDYNNMIWRCYPVCDENNLYIPTDIRSDKIKPNSHQIITNIIKLSTTIFNISYPIIYRNMKTSTSTYSIEWNQIVKKNNQNIIKMIKKLQCNHVLDLGCGNGKLLDFISCKKYHGIDLDVNMLAKAYTKYNMKEDIQFSNLNLGTELSGENIGDNIFDTIVAINSLQYFSTSLFWKKLNTITRKNSKFLFNLVNITNNTVYHFNKIKSYIERNDNFVKYYFDTIHTNEMTEPYIDNINTVLETYGWKIIEEYSNVSHEGDNSITILTDCYKWYIAIRL